MRRAFVRRTELFPVTLSLNYSQNINLQIEELLSGRRSSIRTGLETMGMRGAEALFLPPVLNHDCERVADGYVG
jgi:hypothetical protein